MSSTLPRTRSLGVADTRSLTRDYKRQIHRPSSLCEAAVHRVGPVNSDLQERLKRTPSQANNLSTTVPTCIVNKKLGGRHAPTRNSLRHSRMALMARNGRGEMPRRWSGESKYRRVTSFIVSAYIFVGIVDVLLALWFLHWVPSLSFQEVPHYTGAAIIASGITSSLIFHCTMKHRANGWKVLKVGVGILLVVSTLSCISVCTFDMLHLIQLAPMECGMKNDLLIHPTTQESAGTATVIFTTESAVSPATNLKVFDRISENLHTEEEEEGSGMNPVIKFSDDEDFSTDGNMEIETAPLSSFEAKINDEIYVNVSVCLCYERNNGWRISKKYPKLNCEEVKNNLPIFLVASCVLMVAGTVLSIALMYLLCTIEKSPHNLYKASKASEIRPFIYKSNFRSMDRIAFNASSPTNGTCSFR